MKNDININGRAFKFQFDLEIQKIKLLKAIDIPKSSYLEVVWKRGQKNISTKIKPQIKGNEDEIFFGETLSMISTCFLNTDNFEFSAKDSSVSVVIYISGAQKLFGSININLCSVLNPRNYQQRGVKYIDEDLNGRAKSKILLKLSSSYVTQMMKSDDQQSIGSGVLSNSYNNTSTYSIVDRRLVDIPSKDTYSVLSYGGPIRYSARKQDGISLRREESAKKVEEPVKDYSNYGYTATNYYNKASNQYNLTRGGSNIQNGPSLPSSATRIPRNSDSDHNKSSAGEQNSRLLIQQQTKRSKLEAEMTKNKVENQELKNKLNQFVRQNMRLKQELRKFTQNNDSRQAETKKQNEELKDRNYVLTNQVRQLKSRFDKYIGLQREYNGLRSQRQNLIRQAHTHEQSIKNIRFELEDYKKQIVKAKENEVRLQNQMRQAKNNKADSEQAKRRQYENKIKDLMGQVDFYQNNSKNLSVLLKEQEQKNKLIQNKLKTNESLLDNQKADHYIKLDELTSAKNKEIYQLNQKLQQKNQQCTKYIVEAQKVKTQMQKYRDQKIRDQQLNKSKLTNQIEKLSIALRDSNSKLQQLQQQKYSLNNQVKNEVVMRSKQTQRNRELQAKMDQSEKKYQKQLNDLRRGIQQLQMENVELNKILSEKSKSLDVMRNSRQEFDQLMKQNLQLQLQLKYKNQSMAKLSNIQQDYGKLKCKFDISQRNIKQLHQQLEKCQRQLKQKNRAYIIECEKSKMLTEEKANNIKSQNQLKQSFNQVKAELQQKTNIIFNGQRQVKEMDFYIGELQHKNGCLMQDLKKVQEELQKNSNQQKIINQLKALQIRNKQLELRDTEKIKTIQNLHKNLGSSNNQIKDLQMISEQRYQQLCHKDNLIAELQNKVHELQNIKIAMDQDLNTHLNDKKTLAKKNQMIMEELFNYKKKFEQEKGRSISTVHVRTSEDYIKLKSLQNELQKKQSQIRKMEKQMMTLENENINLNIQVMKKLEIAQTPQ